MQVLIPIGCSGCWPSPIIRFLWLNIVMLPALIIVIVAEVTIIFPVVKFFSLILVIVGNFCSSLSMPLLWVVGLGVRLGCKPMATSIILLMILRLRLKLTSARWSYSVRRLLLQALPVLSCRVEMASGSLASSLLHTMIIGPCCTAHTLWWRSIIVAVPPARLIQVTLWSTSLSSVDGLLPAIATVASVLVPLVHLITTVVKFSVTVIAVVILLHFVTFVSIAVIGSLCDPDTPGIPVVRVTINFSPLFWTAVKLSHIFVKIIQAGLWTIIFHSNCRCCMVAKLLSKSLLMHLYCATSVFQNLQNDFSML